MMITPRLKQRTISDACKALFLKMKAFYAETAAHSQLKTLTPAMLMKKNHAKLRAKAGEARCLIGFPLYLCREFQMETSEEKAAYHAAVALAGCYACLAHDSFDHEKMKLQAKEFALQYTALHETAVAFGRHRWALKPKFHLFLELCLQSSSPALTWTYRDEDFGGSMSAVASRRGGKNSPKAIGCQVLQRFRALHSVPLAP